jgi:hypothetical protein
VLGDERVDVGGRHVRRARKSKGRRRNSGECDGVLCCCRSDRGRG